MITLGEKKVAIQCRTAKLMFVLSTHYATILIGIGKQHTGDRYIGNPAIDYRTEKKSKILVTGTRRVLKLS